MSRFRFSHSWKMFGNRRYEGRFDLVQANPKPRDDLERFFGYFLPPLSRRNGMLASRNRKFTKRRNTSPMRQRGCCRSRLNVALLALRACIEATSRLALRATDRSMRTTPNRCRTTDIGLLHFRESQSFADFLSPFSFVVFSLPSSVAYTCCTESGNC